MTEEMRLMPLADIKALEAVVRVLEIQGIHIAPAEAVRYMLDELGRLRSMVRDRDILIARYRAWRGENRSPVAGQDDEK